jgi:DNA-binding transcriptional LysR family regulator
MQPHLERTFEAAQSAKQLAVGFKKGEIARLRLGVVNSVAGHVLSNVLTRVRDGVPNFELLMDGGSHSDVVEDALEGELDLVILGHDIDLPDRLRSWALFRESFRLVMPEGHRLAQARTVGIGDLEGETFIERAQCAACNQLRQFCAAAGVTLQFPHRAMREDQVQSMVRAGLGLALVPQTVAVEDGLVAKAIEGTDIQRVVTLGAVSGRRFSPASDAFVKLARTCDWARLPRLSAAAS